MLSTTFSKQAKISEARISILVLTKLFVRSDLSMYRSSPKWIQPFRKRPLVVNSGQMRLVVMVGSNPLKETSTILESLFCRKYAARCHIDFRSYCLDKWGHIFASIPVLDYIIINTDRHTQNYGFFMNNDTGELERIAPLFDFNCALVADYFNRDARDTLSQMFNSAETLRELACQFQPHANIQFNEQKFFRLMDRNKEYEYIFDKV